MILNATFASLALLSLALLLWQWLVARRFPVHRRVSDNSFTPDVTLLKPLKGCDSATENCLRSWFTQRYAGRVQILFAVASAEDPVGAIVRRLQQEFPGHDAQLVVCGPLFGANAKVSKLAQLELLAKHDLLVISDADVRVPPDFLANVVAPLRESVPFSESADAGFHAERGHSCPQQRASWEPGTESAPHDLSEVAADRNVRAPLRPCALVNCFYRLANPTTTAMQWEAIAINADFWSQVLQSRSLKPLDFALGAVMVVRRRQLEEIGGFDGLKDCLADDYQLGNRLARRGYRLELSPVVVECCSEAMDWSAVWKHQLRWARTIRVCQPGPYFFSILSNPTLWPLLWVAICPGVPSLAFFGGSWLVRAFVALNLQALLHLPPSNPSDRSDRSDSPLSWLWLVPLKDLLQAALWLMAYLGNHVEWRGQRFRLRRDGLLVKI